MARRRVLHIKVECPGITEDLGVTANKHLLIGKMATLQKSSSNSDISVAVDGEVVGRLKEIVGSQVSSAMDRGQSFTALIENASQNYDERFKPTIALLHLRIEYLLEKGQPPIEVPKAPLDTQPSAPTSFFTKVAGVTHNGRQRIVARCSVGEVLTLIRDPNNRFDKGAIKLIRSNGEQLGFIPAHVSRCDDPSGLASRMDRGDAFQCRISSLTGGDGLNLGVNIEITEGQEATSIPRSPIEPATLSSLPEQNNGLGWLFAALAVLFLMIVFLAYNRS